MQQCSAFRPVGVWIDQMLAVDRLTLPGFFPTGQTLPPRS
jgi:hypothetical protein